MSCQFLLLQRETNFAHLSTSVGNTDIATRVALLRKLAGEEIIEFGAEDTVSDELALLADLARHFSGRLPASRGNGQLAVHTQSVIQDDRRASSPSRSHSPRISLVTRADVTLRSVYSPVRVCFEW